METRAPLDNPTQPTNNTKPKSEVLAIKITPSKKSTPTTFNFNPSSVKKSPYLKADRHDLSHSDEETKSTSRSSPSTSGQHSPQKKHGAFLDTLSHPFASKEKEFDHAIFTDTQLENFLFEVRDLKKKMDGDISNERVTRFNNSIKKLSDHVTKKMVKKATALEELKSHHIKFDKKLILADKLQEKHKDFIKKAKLKIEKYNTRFLHATLHELYNQLKQIIVNHIWDKNVSKLGGEYILDQYDNKVSVPTGIEQMIRILADLIPLPQKKTCCSIRFFKPTPVSRVSAERNEVLSQEELVIKIIKLINVAMLRLTINTDDSRATYPFYQALKTIDPTKLLHLEALVDYFAMMEDLNGKYGLISFQRENSPTPN